MLASYLPALRASRLRADRSAARGIEAPMHAILGRRECLADRAAAVAAARRGARRRAIDRRRTGATAHAKLRHGRSSARCRSRSAPSIRRAWSRSARRCSSLPSRSSTANAGQGVGHLFKIDMAGAPDRRSRARRGRDLPSWRHRLRRPRIWVPVAEYGPTADRSSIASIRRR